MPTVTLTPQFIKESLICPLDKTSITYYCETLGGFAVNVSRGKPGKGLYRYQHKVAGKSTWEKLGSTEDTTLDQARAKALQIKASRLKRPKAQPQPDVIQRPETLRKFFEVHYIPYVKSRKRSWRRDEEMYRLRLDQVFGSMPLAAIPRQAVQKFHAGLHDSGLAPATADHHVKLLRFALNLAVEWGYLEKNPIAGIKLFNADNKVETLLTEDQLRTLVSVLEADRNRTVCQIALFLLSTGARLSEALKARWEHVDLKSGMWKIPASQAKSKRLRNVPLNDSALQVLRRLSTQGRHPYLFVNENTGKPYTTIMKVWSRLREKAGLPHLRIHDLRHTFASLLVAKGRTLYETQVILGHSDPKVTMRYARFAPDALRQAANAASLLH